MAETEKYPLDFDALEKGQYIDAETLTHIFNVRPGTQLFSLKTMQLKMRIECERADLIARGEGQGIRILTDEEAGPYLHGRMEAHVRGLAKTSQKRSRIDPNALTPEQRAMHESENRIGASVAVAARQAMRKQLRIEALQGYKRLPEVAGQENEESED